MAYMELMPDGGLCYYSVRGICKQSSDAKSRLAYRKPALKWHPDRRMKDAKIAGDAKRKFQEAYSAVLSNKKKRSIYDAGLLGLLGDDGFCQFMQEMVLMIKSEKCKEENSLKTVQRVLAEMADGDEIARLNFSLEEPIKGSRKKRRSDHRMIHR